MSNQWYLQTRAGKSGPFTDEQVMEMARQGVINRTSLLRREGDVSWHNAGSIGGLFSKTPAVHATSPSPLDKPSTPECGTPTSEMGQRLPPPLPPLVSSPRKPNKKGTKNKLVFWITGTVMGLFLLFTVACFALWPEQVFVFKSEEPPKKEVTTQPAVPTVAGAPRGRDEAEDAGKSIAPDSKSASSKETENQEANQSTSTPLESGTPEKQLAKESPTSPTTNKSDSLSPPTESEPEHSASPLHTSSAGQLSTEEVVSKTSPSVAVILGRLGSGSGFMVDKTLLATNRHVIEHEVDTDLKVFFPSRSDSKEKSYSARLIYVDPKRDLAFLMVECDVEPLPLAEDFKFAGGQDIIAIGSPGVILAEGKIVPNAVSKGVLSAEITLRLDGQQYYQMGIAINHGNSGGPILNLKGQVVGVATAGEVDFSKDQITYCVPVGELLESKKQVIKQRSEDIEQLRSLHRARVVYQTAENAGEYYSKVFEIFKDAAREAVTTKSQWQSAVIAARVLTSKNFPIPSDANLDSIKSHSAAASTDMLIYESARKSMVETISNLGEMHRFMDKGESRSLQTFVDKMIELKDKHVLLIEKLKLELGIPD